MAYVPIPRLDLSQNRELPATLIGVNAYQQAMNVDFRQGVARKRDGLQTWVSGLAGVPMGVWTFTSSTGVRSFVAATSTHLYTVADTTFALTDRTPAGYSAPLGSPVRAASMGNAFYVTTGAGFYSWDGVAATFVVPAAGAPQHALDVLMYGNHLLVTNIVTSGGATDPFAIQWSDYLNGGVWNSGDAGTIDLPDGGDPTMALGLLGGSAVLWKRDSIYQIATIPAPLFYGLSRSPGNIGTIATATVQPIPGSGFAFLWRDDVYTYNGLVPQPMWGRGGETVRRDIFSTLNQAFIQAAFAVLDVPNAHYLLFIPTARYASTAPDYAVFVFDWRAQTWTEYDFHNVPGGISGGGDGEVAITDQRRFTDSPYAFNVSPYNFNSVVSQSRAPALTLGGATTGILYQGSPTVPRSDGGYPYRSTVTTGLADFDAPYPQRKTITGVHTIYTEQSTGVMDTYLQRSDDGTTTTTVGPLQERLVAPMSVWADFVSTGVWQAVQLDDNSRTDGFEARAMTLQVDKAGER